MTKGEQTRLSNLQAKQKTLKLSALELKHLNRLSKKKREENARGGKSAIAGRLLFVRSQPQMA